MWISNHVPVFRWGSHWRKHAFSIFVINPLFHIYQKEKIGAKIRVEYHLIIHKSEAESPGLSRAKLLSCFIAQYSYKICQILHFLPSLITCKIKKKLQFGVIYVIQSMLDACVQMNFAVIFYIHYFFYISFQIRIKFAMNIMAFNILTVFNSVFYRSYRYRR
jgi:hypothetical protein